MQLKACEECDYLHHSLFVYMFKMKYFGLSMMLMMVEAAVGCTDDCCWIDLIKSKFKNTLIAKGKNRTCCSSDVVCDANGNVLQMYVLYR